MKVFIEEKNKETIVDFTGTVGELLKKLRISPASVLVTRNEKIISIETLLSNADSVAILEVFMGG